MDSARFALEWDCEHCDVCDPAAAQPNPHEARASLRSACGRDHKQKDDDLRSPVQMLCNSTCTHDANNGHDHDHRLSSGLASWRRTQTQPRPPHASSCAFAHVPPYSRPLLSYPPLTARALLRCASMRDQTQQRSPQASAPTNHEGVRHVATTFDKVRRSNVPDKCALEPKNSIPTHQRTPYATGAEACANSGWFG